MRVVFVTHNELGLACMEELQELGADVRALFTRPPDPDISDQIAFDEFAREHDIDHHEVTDVNEPENVERIRSYDPELLFVVGWSRLVEQPVIDASSHATLGMHPAPLPRGRGRAPVAWSLIRGLSETRLVCFHLVEAADAGDVAAEVPIEIDRTDDAADLYEKVVDAGRDVVSALADQYEAGGIERHPQDDDMATWWPKRTPTDGIVDWHRSPSAVYDWIRGQSRPYPGAFTLLGDRKVTLWAARPPTGEPAVSTPGQLAYTDGDALGVGALEGYVEVTRLQVEDDPEISAADLVTEYDMQLGDQFRDVRDLAAEQI